MKMRGDYILKIISKALDQNPESRYAGSIFKASGRGLSFPLNE
jgi:hypothetical protein